MVDRPDRSFDLLSLGSFVALGLPDGMLGTAWPAMRHSFGVPVGDLGLILLVTTAGAVAVAGVVGRLLRSLGVPALLATATGGACLGALAYALAPGLWLVLAVGAVSGAAAGTMDGGLNTAVGLAGRPRLLNLLHGFYGIGTAVGPLVVTAAILAGSWRPAYLVLAGINLATAGLWLRYRRGPAAAEPAPAGGQTRSGERRHPSRLWSRRRTTAVLAFGMAVFFVYTGLEVAAGAWEASFARGHLGLAPGAAGLATFGYWGAMTAVRIGLALPARGVAPGLVIKVGGAGSLVATGLIWWQPAVAVTLLGFVLLGASLAGIFPALVAATPLRIGEERARHAIAWQVGAAAAGGSAVSALIGLVIDHRGLAVLGPALTALAVFLAAGYAVLGRFAPLHDSP